MDNNLIHYDNRSFFKRFKPPYLKEKFVKTIIKGNISDLKYLVHNPLYSPLRNVSCLNNGEQICKNTINIESVEPINLDKAFLIHFRYNRLKNLSINIKEDIVIGMEIELIMF